MLYHRAAIFLDPVYYITAIYILLGGVSRNVLFHEGLPGGELEGEVNLPPEHTDPWGNDGSGNYPPRVASLQASSEEVGM